MPKKTTSPPPPPTLQEEAGLGPNWQPVDVPAVHPGNPSSYPTAPGISRPAMGSYFSGSIPPAMQLQPDTVNTQYQGSGIPSVRLMPVGASGNPNIVAAAQSVAQSIVDNNPFGLKMPVQYTVTSNKNSAVVTWVPVAASLALLGPIPSQTITYDTPYINWSFSSNSFGAQTPAFPTWSSHTGYTVSNQVVANMSGRIIDSNGNIQTVTIGGTSKTGSHPTWNVTTGGTTTDNTVTWRNDGPATNIFNYGDLLFFLASSFNEHVTSISDTLGNTWAPATTEQSFTDYNSGKTVYLRGWYAVVTTPLTNGSSYTITPSFTSTGSSPVIGNCITMVVSGMSTSPLTALQNGHSENLPGATPNPFQPGSITTTGQQFLLNLVFADSTIASGPVGWFTAAGNPGSGSDNTGIYGLVAGSGSYNPATDGFAGVVTTAQSIVLALNLYENIVNTSVNAAPTFREIQNFDLTNAIFGASGANHQAGAVPDPGSTPGNTRVLLENATWGNVPVYVNVNGSQVNSPNFNNTTPAAPSNQQNVTWQVSGSNISAYVPDSSVEVNGSTIFGANFNNTSPAAPANQQNVTWQVSNNNVSAYVPDTSVEVNGTTIYGPNFNSSPAAPTGSVNVTWQDSLNNVSAYVQEPAGLLNEQTGNYNIKSTDNGSLVVLNSSSAATFTLLGTAPAAPWFIFVKNIGTGVLTISRNSLTIDGRSTNVTLTQGDGTIISSDGSNYWTGQPRPFSLGVFIPGVGTNSQVCLYWTADRPCIFPASAPNSQAKSKAAATGSTTYTLYKNSSSFATVVWSGSGSTGSWTQSSDSSFAVGDILEIDGPATADATLANVGITFQGFRF